ncbi:hypothetical protein [Kutzneria kofuensis]|uniref:Uncharacterized protein n=1 Tax=Kutzneria kofuensis TaxID=103725 RepID=A0A7W9KDJ4_9PSEU|nr:hypothetical protein [Kutzneria kofuensis]MBB5890517.1 hypothetical protein [Kutzneria kofuensis]
MSLKSWAVAAATVALLAVGAPASAATSTIDGSYAFNGNGWAGTLLVSGSASGAPAITMHYTELGRDERLTGSWSAASRTLTINRPLQWNNSQTYTLYLGDHKPNQPVFGGYFTQSDVPGQRYGVYAKDYLPLGTPRTKLFKANDSLPDDLVGFYGFNGNGWTGTMSVQFTQCRVPEINLRYDELGRTEPIAQRTWDPATHTLTFVRPLSFGGVTQTYTLYFANRLQSTQMFGGYFTQSDVPGQRYAAFAFLQPGGVGC